MDKLQILIHRITEAASCSAVRVLHQIVNMILGRFGIDVSIQDKSSYDDTCNNKLNRLVNMLSGSSMYWNAADVNIVMKTKCVGLVIASYCKRKHDITRCCSMDWLNTIIATKLTQQQQRLKT